MIIGLITIISVSTIALTTGITAYVIRRRQHNRGMDEDYERLIGRHSVLQEYYRNMEKDKSPSVIL